MKNRRALLILLLIGLVLIAITLMEVISFLPRRSSFNGPRLPDSQAHANTAAHISMELPKSGWNGLSRFSKQN